MPTRVKSPPKPKYLKGYGEAVASFVEETVVHTKGRWAGEPFILEPWQQDAFDELFLVDAKGDRIYREALIGLPRKNGKSSLVATLCLYGLLASGENSPEIYCAAASRDQARIIFDQARQYIEASPQLSKWLKPQRSVILCPSNNGIFRVLSSDAPLQHGLNPWMVAIDELWAHKDPELFWALTTGMIAREDPLIVSITTAGWDRESVCYQVYERGSALQAKGGIEAMREEGFLHLWYEAKEGLPIDDPKTWMAANPASWVTPEVLAPEFRRLPEAVFRRLHLNQWTETEDAWISPERWDACAGKPIIEFDVPTWMGLDIGLRRDATALAAAQFHADDVHIAQKIRTPQPGAPITAGDVRQMVRKEASQYSALREIAYDPWSFRESAEILADEGFPMVEYQQSNALMAPASARLYETVVETRLVHDGDPTMRKHVLSAVATETDRGWRISKRKSKERIDGAIALTQAVDRAILSRMEPRIDPDDYRIEQL